MKTHANRRLHQGLFFLVLCALLGVVLFWYSLARADTAVFPSDRAQPIAQTDNDDNNDDRISTSTADHTQFEALVGPFATGPDVTTACLECHTEAATQLMATSHWTWEHESASGETLGKNNVINNFCVAVSSNEPRCTSCHTGYGYKDNTFDFTNQNNVDCLVCHDTTGTYKKFPTAAGHPLYEPKEFPAGSGNIWQPPDLAMVAQNVGPTSRQTCGSCHFTGGGGDGVKHGDIDTSLTNPSFELDVHMSADGQGFTCTTCHTADQHNIAGSYYNITAKDSPAHIPALDDNLATCESCHGTAPMQDQKLNDHVATIACQTCHVPEFAREKPTKMWWDWATAGQKDADGKPFKTTDENGWIIYDTQKGDFTWEKNVIPEYIWFNGDVEFTLIGDEIDPSGVVPINTFMGSPDDGRSRIWPVKVFAGNQPYDTGNNVLVVPHLFGQDESAFWKSYDWNKSIEAGMSSANLPYSGEYGFVESEMLWPITHMVAPATDALECSDCHSKNGRLAKVEGVYIPGRDSNNIVTMLGWGMIGLSIVGVVLHGSARIVSTRRRKTTLDKKEETGQGGTS